MIHPNTRLAFIDNQKGYGIFATSHIPKGTLVYVKDLLEIEISPADFDRQPKTYQDIIEKYSYIDERGKRILSWDLGKYVNHCCHPNTISTGYGFEIAVKDILPGEEITDEYGLFNLEYEMEVHCNKEFCRGKICRSDIDKYAPKWDIQIKDALKRFKEVEQPLESYLAKGVKGELEKYFEDPSLYKSVATLKFKSIPTASKAVSSPSPNAF